MTIKNNLPTIFIILDLSLIIICLINNYQDFNILHNISSNTIHCILSKEDKETQTNISKEKKKDEGNQQNNNTNDVWSQTENISFDDKNIQTISPQEEKISLLKEKENNVLDINSNDESNIIDISSFNENNVCSKKDNVLDLTSFKIKDNINEINMNIPGSYLESYDDNALYDYVPDPNIPGTYLESYDNIKDNWFINLKRSFKYFYNFIKPSKKNDDEIDYFIKDKELLNNLKEISILQDDVYNPIPTYKMSGEYPNNVYYDNLLEFNENTPKLDNITIFDLYSNIDLNNIQSTLDSDNYDNTTPISENNISSNSENEIIQKNEVNNIQSTLDSDNYDNLSINNVSSNSEF